jgi:hypothetical protein
VACWSFVESAFGKDGFFKGFSPKWLFIFCRNKLKWHPVIFLSKSNWHPSKNAVQNVAPRLKRYEKQSGERGLKRKEKQRH